MNEPREATEAGYPDERQMESPYTTRQHLMRVLWWIGEVLLFRASLRPMYAWRRWVLRLYGAKMGPQSMAHRTADIECPWNLTMGRCSSIGDHARVYNLAEVVLGEFATVSQYAYLCGASHDYTRPEMPQILRPIVVGRGAWVATEAFVGPGVHIGDNAVIGACSVVVKDMPAGMVCAGNPCRPIKPRLPEGNDE